MNLIQTLLTSLADFSVNTITLAAITFGGMVLSVLGAFYLIDSIRFPRELVRTGKSLAPLYDEIFVLQGIPWEPVWPRPLSIVSIWHGVASSIVMATALAVVVGLGYRRGEEGIFIGAALGLGLGLAIVLRRLVHRIAALPGFGHLSEFIGMALYLLSAISATVIMYVAGLLLLSIAFILMLALWLILLPLIACMVLVRLALHRPSRAIALVAPFAALSNALRSRGRRRAMRAQRNPFDDSVGARFERRISSWFPLLQKFILGIVIGHLYALVGSWLLANDFVVGGRSWLFLGGMVAFGFAVERIFEIVVQSLFHDDLTEFVDEGPRTLAGLRVGLLTGLTLGTIGGLITSNSTLLQLVREALSGFPPTDVAVVVTSSVVVLLLWLLPNVLGYAASWFVDRFSIRVHHLRAGLGFAGAAFLLIGIALQLVQYAVAVR
ncbi:MAG TPA: hypothetical protein VH593_13270 [Ktedonobacteraceae bacterium]|jgi:hypothetical protein